MLRTRDQERALHAYACAEGVDAGMQSGYKTHVNSLGSAVLRNGLAAAISFVERERKPGNAAALLLDHLAAAQVPGLKSKRGAELPAEVRGLSLGDYMLATREVLKLLVWFRRAVQATFRDDPGGRE